MVHRYRRRGRGNPWCGVEDWEAAALEAACRVIRAFPGAAQENLDNLIAVAARNALINLRRKLSLVVNTELPAEIVLPWIPSPRDELATALTKVWAFELTKKLRSGTGRVYRAILDAWLSAEDPPAATELALRLGICPDTVRSRRDEVRRVAARELRIA